MDAFGLSIKLPKLQWVFSVRCDRDVSGEQIVVTKFWIQVLWTDLGKIIGRQGMNLKIIKAKTEKTGLQKLEVFACKLPKPYQIMLISKSEC